VVFAAAPCPEEIHAHLSPFSAPPESSHPPLGNWSVIVSAILLPTVGQGTSFGDALAVMLSSSSGEVRSVLTLADSGISDPNRNASGRLVDASGAALANATVAVQYAPINGAFAQYSALWCGAYQRGASYPGVPRERRLSGHLAGILVRVSCN
jgi:hypothetical protein